MMQYIFLVCFFILANFPFATTQSTEFFDETPLFVLDGKRQYNCYRIPAIIKAPNGHLLAFAEGRTRNCNDFGDVDIVMRKSKDNGNSWASLKTLVDNNSLQAGNPAPVVDLLDPEFPKGRIFLFYNTGTNHEGEIRKGNGIREVWYITSTDNGKHWSEPVNITTSVHRPNNPAANPKYTDPEDWRSYAITPGHAIQLKHAPHAGRIFVPANHSQGEPQDGFNEYKAHAFYSDDHGKTWNLSQSVEIPSSNESIAVELSDGRVMQNIRHQNGSQRKRLVAISSDGGASWDTTFFDPQLPSPVCQASIIEYQAPDQKKVFLFSNPNSSTSRQNMTIKVSYDDGQNWSLSRTVHEDKSAYSDLVIQDSDKIGLLYEQGNEGGIYYARFNYEWLINGTKYTAPRNNSVFAKESQFQLSSPIISYQSVLFEKENLVQLALNLEGGRIHYTLDGSEPTEQSPMFKDKIVLKRTTTLKAKAFHPHALPSDLVEAHFRKLGPLLPIKDVAINRTPHENYPGLGAQGLVDRKRGTSNFRTAYWLGFSGGDLETVVEFQDKTPIQKVTTSLLSDPDSWIFLPQAIEIHVSDDGKNFALLATQNIQPTLESAQKELKFVETAFPQTSTKTVKIVLKNIPEIPAWHPGKGTPPWLFIDEILIE